jgi:hypothetical protein
MKDNSLGKVAFKLTDKKAHIQDEQKVSVHMTITVQTSGAKRFLIILYNICRLAVYVVLSSIKMKGPSKKQKRQIINI